MNERDVDDLFKTFEAINKILEEGFTGGFRKLDIPGPDENELNDILTEDKNHVYITTELRVEEENLSINIEPYKLNIQVLYNGRILEQNIKLPCKVKTKGKITFNNYILDIVLTKDKRRVKNGKTKKSKKRKKSR